MRNNMNQTIHTAEDAALGFYYQTFYALLTLLKAKEDDSAVCVEGLDDVQLIANGTPLLIQLKHSMAANPTSITVKSKSVWRTLKVWIDALPHIDLSATDFHLVAVGEIDPLGPLALLLTDSTQNRGPLCDSLVDEAQRVVNARLKAKEKGTSSIPHEDKYLGCEALLGLTPSSRLNLVSRIKMIPGSVNIAGLEGLVCDCLHILPKTHREAVTKKLIGWWDREVVYSLCGKRNRFITNQELQKIISELVSEIVQDRLLPDFETANPPKEYQPDGLLTKQIELVDGAKSDLVKAIREEWRAREQRSKWINDNSGMASKIDDYDAILEEHWRDSHSLVVEESENSIESKKRELGRKVLRWSHDTASSEVRAFADGWGAPYYVRGSYQVLAIGLRVGWHPDYKEKLGGTK
jgi:hypothetical protein